MTREKIDRIGYSDIFRFVEEPSVFFFEAGMMIDADGAYRAYHPEKSKGLDYLANAGSPGNWWALVTDNGKKSGSPIIQKSNDPATGFYISTTSLQDSSKGRTDPTKYVDSESIPFFVLPGNSTFGATLGDFGMVINPANGKMSACIFADTGPKGKIGEGSIALAAAIDIPSSPKKGGVAHGIAYIVFGGSKSTWPLSVAEINAKATAEFQQWGGISRLKQGLPSLDWA